MESLPENKTVRLLEIYTHLIKGDVLSKTELATQYHISRRSIQRDMEALRTFIANQNLGQDVVYDYKHRGYRLIQTNPKWLSNSEILAVCKILLESRSLRKDEMLPILDKLVDCAVPDPNKKLIGELIANETFHYIQPHHNKLVLDNLWALGEAVRHQQPWARRCGISRWWKLNTLGSKTMNWSSAASSRWASCSQSITST